MAHMKFDIPVHVLTQFPLPQYKLFLFPESKQFFKTPVPKKQQLFQQSILRPAYPILVNKVSYYFREVII